MVKLAVTFLFTAALAVATVRAQEAGAETVEEVLSRDVSSTESDLFGRAAAKVMNDLFSREELSEVYGRDFEADLTWRDVTELIEREAVDMSEIEELAARAGAPQDAPEEAADSAPAPKPKGHAAPAKPGKHEHQSVFGQVLSFFNRLVHPNPKTAATTTPKGKGKEVPKKDDKPVKAEKAPVKDDAPAPEGAAEGAEEARDFLDSVLEEPVERSLGEEVDLTERDILSDDEALEVRAPLDDAELELEVRELLDDAALELEVRELLEAAELELAERSFEDEDLLEARELLEEYSDLIERDFDEDVYERDVEEDLLERDVEEDLLERDVEEDLLERDVEEDLFEREFEDELLERDFDEDVYEREFEDDLLEREVEEDLLEREFEEDVFEREVGDELDDELLRRAFDLVEELEMLD